MIELKFYRDDEYVYINNPDGTTKRVPIEDFENTFNVDTAELPTYTSSDAGKVLTVSNAGTGIEWDESSVCCLHLTISGSTYTSDLPFSEIDRLMKAHKLVYVTTDATTASSSAQLLGFVNYTDSSDADSEYSVSVLFVGSYGADNVVLMCDSTAGYPSYTES